MPPLPSPSWIRPRVTIFAARVSTFQICGTTGLLLGTCLAIVLADRTGLSRVVVCALLAIGIVTFLALAMATKVITGKEALVYYHHEVAVLAASGALLGLLGLPVLPYLDVTALGLGVFLACGRCGCLMVGCCHGRPHRWGVRYGLDHATEGFPDCYVGVRLFPVQALECVLVALFVVTGSALVIGGSPAGSALTWYVVSYSAARVWIEELRGDRARPYWLRLSEAQWTSLILISGVLLAEWQGRFPFAPGQVLMWIGVVISMAMLAIGRTAAHAVLHPRHASEVATIVKGSEPVGGPVVVRRTSLGIGISTQALAPAGGDALTLYSLSRAGRPLTNREAQALTGLIGHLAGTGSGRQVLIPGGHDVFHLVVRDRYRTAAVPLITQHA
jgi:prolipoprotein diacylglyceryltransferase